MNTKLYLDTSIPSAFYDSSKPVRQLMTQKWFEFDRTNYSLNKKSIEIFNSWKSRDPQLVENK
jgi:hypothetical protein